MTTGERIGEIIRIENLVFAYEQEDDSPSAAKPAVDGVSFDVEKGSFTAILGGNGSGKSTLSLNLNALLTPTSGRVLVEGMDTADADKVWNIRSTVGMVFQNPDNQLVSSIVEDDVAFGPENLGVEPAEIRRRVDDSLKAVAMYDFRKKGPHLLSGGQKQRVAIAGVLAMNPDCIVFDEPTAMLDPSGRNEVMKIIEDLHSSGKTVILITHFMEEAAKADNIIIMNSGKVVLSGAPRDIFTEANEDRLKELCLELPFAVKMARALRDRGIDIPEDIVTQEGLVSWLCR